MNLKKSVIILIREVRNVYQLAKELGSKLGSLPTSYLGLPLGARLNAVSVWEEIEEKLRGLACWKPQYILKSGG